LVGVVAQLVERLVRNEKVAGSNPVGSTILLFSRNRMFMRSMLIAIYFTFKRAFVKRFIQFNTMKLNSTALITFLSLALATASQAAVNYAGNGAAGFGGSVGSGSVDISDSLSGLTLTLNRGAGTLDNDLVIYLDTQPGGFTDTSTFSDNGDGGRTAISGFNGGNPSRTLLSFAPGFAADYAISIEKGFIGVFSLASGGNNSLGYLFGQAQSGNNNDASYSINITPAQMSQIGLTAGSGQTFLFDGSLISTSAYRANETIGASTTVPVDGSGNAGFNNPQSFTQSLSYTIVPEPSSLALIGLGIAGFVSARRRK
jgi:hypothetical protein